MSIRPKNNKGQRHGLWEIYSYGNLSFKRFFHNGKMVGYEEYYTYLGNRGLTEKKYNL